MASNTGRFSGIERVRYARFRRPGETVAGTVLEITEVPVPDIVDGRVVGPRFDANGTIVTQTDIKLDVDGNATVVHARTMVGLAIGEALEQANVADLSVGDHLTLTYVTDEDSDEEIPAKLYEAKVVPAAKPKPDSKG